MKRRIAVLVVMALAASACGGGEDETRNAVITPQVAGGAAIGTFGLVSTLQYDAKTKSVHGGTWAPRIEEGVMMRGAGIVSTSNPGDTSATQAFPEVVGNAETVLPDGNGGWWLAGLMEQVGSSRNQHLVHINPDGSLDQNFPSPVDLKENPFGRHDQVLLLADHPVAAGHLVMVARVTRAGDRQFAAATANCARIIVINKSTGAVTDRFDLDGSCPDRAVLAGKQVVLAGSFAVFKGQVRNRVAGFDLETKAASLVGVDFGAVHPSFNVDANTAQSITRLAVSGNTLYVFGRIARNGQFAAALDTVTGKVTQWKPVDLLPAGIGAFQISESEIIVTKENVVIAGCLGAVSPDRFVAYNRTTGARSQWNPGIEWAAGDCTGSFDVFAMGDTFLVQGQFTGVRGRTVPNMVWLGPDGSPMPSQPSIAIDWWRRSSPHSPVTAGRYFPELKRMFLSVGWGSLLVNSRAMGPYLAASDTGVTKPTQLEWALPDQKIEYSFVTAGHLYAFSTPTDFDSWEFNPERALTVRRIIHRFDPATGARDTGFQIDHTGLVAYKIVVGETKIAVIGSQVDADGAHIRLYSRADGSPAGSYPPAGGDGVFAWPVGNATAEGDNLFLHGAVPTDGGGERYALGVIDMGTGNERVVTDGLTSPCYCDPVVVGSRILVSTRRQLGDREHIHVRALDIATGQVVRDITEWDLEVEMMPVRFGDRVLGPAMGVNGGLGLVAVDADTFEPVGSFAAGVRFNFYVPALTATADRLYVWFDAPVRQVDGTVLTGVVAFDTEGRPTMTSVPDPVVSTEVMPQEPVAPVGDNPVAEIAQRAVSAAAGRITVESVRAGNRSLTVGFSVNGNDGPYDVREAGGRKICTTSGNTCTFTNLTAHSSYSFTVESRGRADESRSQPSSAAKPVVLLKKGKTLKLSTVLKPASKTAVKWKSSKACTLDARKGTLKAPKKGAVCSVTVTSRAQGKAAVTRSITVLVS